MKHVFIVNSHTTFLTSLGTVAYLHLQDDEVLFLYMRNYKNSITPVPYQIVNCDDMIEVCRDITSQYKSTIKKVDAFIDKYLTGKYSLYVPHLWHYFFQILYTHNRCIRVSFVQEGGAPFTNVFDNETPFIERIKSFIRHAILRRRTFECKWYKRGTLYKQRVLDSYAINNVYFRYLRSVNHIVQWPKTKLDIIINPQSPIFVFDGFLRNGLVEHDVYLSCCKEIINKKASKTNYIKFHPAQSDDERETIISYFKSANKDAELMRDDVPIENIITQFTGLTFIGFTSSLLYYAHDFNHNVVCCEDLIWANSSLFRQFKEESGFLMFHETYKNDK